MQRRPHPYRQTGKGSKGGPSKGSAKKEAGPFGWMALAFAKFGQETRERTAKINLSERSLLSLIQNNWEKMTLDEKGKYLNLPPIDQVS